MTILSPKQQAMSAKLSPGNSQAAWNDWKWQLRHSIRDISQVEAMLSIEYEPEERRKLEQTITKFPLSITPHYLSLIDREDFRHDPVYRQAVPSPEELNVGDCEMTDPLHEDADSPVPGLTHRYPDRVLFHVSNMCSMYCRHCTRKRKVGDVDSVPTRDQVQAGLDYIRAHREVRDVLLSGGDPFLLEDEALSWMLGELRIIKHVEIIRIGTRTPVVLPQRITDDLVNLLKQYHPLWINTHFNHPREFSRASKLALRKLADAGIPLGNQSVLLAGVNDCPRIMKALVHKLVANRVRPYYLYQCDLSEGLSHFRTPVSKGIEIIESLVGHTSGLAVPTYVIDAPGGGGKIPIMPSYLISWSTHKVVLRNYEGVITTYREPDSYPAIECDRDCERCTLQLKIDDAIENDPVGIAKLQCFSESTISLVPAGNQRIRRRNKSARGEQAHAPDTK